MTMEPKQESAEVVDRMESFLVSRPPHASRRVPSGEPISLHWSRKGARGILESQSFWLSSVAATNDASEHRHGIILFLHETKEVINGLARGLVRSVFEELLERITPDGLGPQPRMIPHVISFCSDGNLLSQWREYGRDGSGMQLEFDLSNWRDRFLLHPQNVHYHLARVIYGEEEQRALVREILSGLVVAAEGFFSEGPLPYSRTTKSCSPPYFM